jgi:hypothetical protein
MQFARPHTTDRAAQLDCDDLASVRSELEAARLASSGGKLREFVLQPTTSDDQCPGRERLVSPLDALLTSRLADATQARAT